MQQPTRQSRCRGALLGLACGDALGTTLEFCSPGSFQPITDMVGGGPFALQPGQWTDDTSMAFCLAASLIARGECDPVDQLRRYVRWRDDGYMSVTGRCFDIGNTVSTALRRFEATGDAASGSTAANSAGNGALMRMAPVIIHAGHDLERTRADARTATVTTHGATSCVQASDVFAVLLWQALQGQPRSALLDGPTLRGWLGAKQLTPQIAAIVDGSFKQKSPPEIRGTGYVVDALEAALWALETTDDFEHGALAAANLGDDADTTTAIYGQLAGALYGEDAIPARWLDILAWRQSLSEIADALTDADNDMPPPEPVARFIDAGRPA